MVCQFLGYKSGFFSSKYQFPNELLPVIYKIKCLKNAINLTECSMADKYKTELYRNKYIHLNIQCSKINEPKCKFFFPFPSFKLFQII